jgi:hypothetical protein
VSDARQAVVGMSGEARCGDTAANCGHPTACPSPDASNRRLHLRGLTPSLASCASNSAATASRTSARTFRAAQLAVSLPYSTSHLRVLVGAVAINGRLASFDPRHWMGGRGDGAAKRISA